MNEKASIKHVYKESNALLRQSDISFNSYNAKLVRVLACMAVVFTHLGAYLTTNPVIKAYFDFGAEGVRAFFILSGFFMCCSSELRNGEITKYLKKRFFRVVPIYYFIISVYVIWGIVGFYPWPKDETGLYWIRYYFFLSTSVIS